MKRTRVRFAPSPTGGLHIGGIRTALYNYLFAKKNSGDFIVRIEDTDGKRFVPGAEEYIKKCLEWLGIEPDESPWKHGKSGPYRQSERTAIYNELIKRLVSNGTAYIAWDTEEELDEMRTKFKTDVNPNPGYDKITRMSMKNSLVFPDWLTEITEENPVPYVIRIKVPETGKITMHDAIRGDIEFDLALVDDKVLMKADGTPTYHFAVVIDDWLMNITHVFRGDEWLTSSPVHLLLWEYLDIKAEMPVYAHLPLILGPDGKKLSKRHGSTYDFPIFGMDWTDPVTEEKTQGFYERGFQPDALLNILALLGWKGETTQEIFSLKELVEQFDISRIHESSAIFDFEKAKWFNHKYIQTAYNGELANQFIELIPQMKNRIVSHERVTKIVSLIKERCSTIQDFWINSNFFFEKQPLNDLHVIKEKWNSDKNDALIELHSAFGRTIWYHDNIMNSLNEIAEEFKIKGIKKKEIIQALRILIVGENRGPGIYDILEVIGKIETLFRIENGLTQLK